MEFDPLAFFTPPTDQEIDEVVVINPKDNIINNHIPNDHINEFIKPEPAEDDHLIPIDVLDLPMLTLKPPANVMLLILKLLAINEVWNFKQDQEDKHDPMIVFQDKQVNIDTLDECLTWLCDYCPRFNSQLKLSAIPILSLSLKRSPSYNDWLTRIISNELKWLNDDDRSEIYKHASLRISENCGRTAQPELIRKIKLDNMDKLGRQYVKLKEPSLTSDNLGLKTWGSSLILGQRLINDHDPIANHLKEPILELGSGTGLIGIICLLLGYKDIYVTDLAPIIPNLKENILVNNLDVDNNNNDNTLDTDMNQKMEMNMHIEELDWGDPSKFISKYPNINFNTIILSDPIYSSDHPKLIANVLNQFVNPDTQILIQIPLRRNYGDIRDKLWQLLNEFLVETRCEYQVGSDEFGDTEYCYKTFRLKGSE